VQDVKNACSAPATTRPSMPTTATAPTAPAPAIAFATAAATTNGTAADRATNTTSATKHTGGRRRRALAATAAAAAVGAEALHKATQRRLAELQRSPAALARRPALCDRLVCDTAPMCFTDFEPRQHVPPEGPAPAEPASAALLVAIGGSSGSGNKTANATNVSSASNGTAAAAVAPVVGPDSRDRFSLSAQVVGRPRLWALELSFFDRGAVAKAEARGLGYIDRKHIFVRYVIVGAAVASSGATYFFQLTRSLSH